MILLYEYEYEYEFLYETYFFVADFCHRRVFSSLEFKGQGSWCGGVVLLVVVLLVLVLQLMVLLVLVLVLLLSSSVSAGPAGTIGPAGHPGAFWSC